MRSLHAFTMSYDRILSPMLAICMSLVPMHNCMGEVDGEDQQKTKTSQDQSADWLPSLDTSQVTFTDDNTSVLFLSSAVQERYRNYQSEFLNYLKQLPSRQQRTLKEVYKWVPDAIKIIASQDYQERKEYIQQFEPGSKFYENTILELYKRRKKRQISFDIDIIVLACTDMIRYRYPSQMIDPKKQDIEAAAKQCGFGYLSKMVDFCNDPKNLGKIYQKSVDKLTNNKTLEEMQAFRAFATIKYEPEIWLAFWQHQMFFVPKFWVFDLKKVDTSNLTPEEYRQMERHLKCVPPIFLTKSRFRRCYREKDRECIKILKDPTYIGKYSRKKGFYLAESEVKEVYKLASELLKYGTPLKLVKRDEKADLGVVANNFGFYRVWAFDSGYKRRGKNNIKRKVKFYESAPEKIPYFIAEAQDFYDLGMAVNPEGTKELYHNIEVDTGIVIRPHGIAPNVSKDNHADAPQQDKKAPSEVSSTK